MSEIHIRPAEPRDHEAIWQIFHEVVQGGDTFAFDPETPREEALRIWTEAPRLTCVAEADGRIVGSYFIKDNQPGLGSHVCNAGYMVAGSARGLGVGRAMCAHSLEEARRLGYTAMQYNIVVSTNTGAVALWQSMGFTIVGTLPGAFRHSKLGPVDAYVMHRSLEDQGLTDSSESAR
jgi:ribosomal protein S18 acetylase RimI-like enzyme